MRAIIVTTLFLAILGGCGYYRVTDPQSGKTYYTNQWVAGRYTMGGAVRFRDDVTGRDVTLQNSEVEQIDKATYLNGVGQPAR